MKAKSYFICFAFCLLNLLNLAKLPALESGIALSFSAMPFTVGGAYYHDIDGSKGIDLFGSGIEVGAEYRVGHFSFGGSYSQRSLEERFDGNIELGIGLAKLVRPSIGLCWYPVDWFFVNASFALDILTMRDGADVNWTYPDRGAVCGSVLMKTGFEYMAESGMGIFAAYSCSVNAFNKGLYESYTVKGHDTRYIGETRAFTLSDFSLGVRWIPAVWFGKNALKG